jgi:hypothetical protein
MKISRYCFYHSSLFSSRFGNFKKTGKKYTEKLGKIEIQKVHSLAGQ